MNKIELDRKKQGSVSILVIRVEDDTGVGTPLRSMQ